MANSPHFTFCQVNLFWYEIFSSCQILSENNISGRESVPWRMSVNNMAFFVLGFIWIVQADKWCEIVALNTVHNVMSLRSSSIVCPEVKLVIWFTYGWNPISENNMTQKQWNMHKHSEYSWQTSSSNLCAEVKLVIWFSCGWCHISPSQKQKTNILNIHTVQHQVSPTV